MPCWYFHESILPRRRDLELRRTNGLPLSRVRLSARGARRDSVARNEALQRRATKRPLVGSCEELGSPILRCLLSRTLAKALRLRVIFCHGAKKLVGKVDTPPVARRSVLFEQLQ